MDGIGSLTDMKMRREGIPGERTVRAKHAGQWSRAREGKKTVRRGSWPACRGLKLASGQRWPVNFLYRPGSHWPPKPHSANLQAEPGPCTRKLRETP